MFQGTTTDLVLSKDNSEYIAEYPQYPKKLNALIALHIKVWHQIKEVIICACMEIEINVVKRNELICKII